MIKAIRTKIKYHILILMALLVLAAPCSIRNNLQSVLQIATTKPLNPSKTLNTVSVSCSLWQNSTKENQVHLHKKQLPEAFSLLAKANLELDLKSNVQMHLQQRKNAYCITPYYILYKRLKIFDLS